MKKDCFLTLRIRITNGWNKECLGGGGGEGIGDALSKIAIKQYLGRLMILDGGAERFI